MLDQCVGSLGRGSHGRDRLALSGSGQGFLTGTLIPMLAPM